MPRGTLLAALLLGAGLALLPIIDGRWWAVVVAYHLPLGALAVIDARSLPRSGFAASRKMLRPLPLGMEQPVQISTQGARTQGFQALVADHAPAALMPEPRVVAGTFDASGNLSTTYAVRSPRRGRFVFGDVDVRLYRRRGLWLRQVRMRVPDEVAVYPNILPIRYYELSLRRGMRWMSGLRRARPPGAATAFAGLRDYLPGDELRRISWTASARIDKPVTKVLEAERGQQVVIALDCGRLMTALAGTLTKLDHAVNAALLSAWVAQSQGDKVGLVTFTDSVKRYLSPQRGAANINRIYETLYSIEAEYIETDFGEAFAQLAASLNRRTLVLVLTDVLDPEASSELVQHALALGSRHLVLVVAMEDPALIAARDRTPVTSSSSYEWAAAEELLGSRRRSFEMLRRGGVIGLDVPAASLSPALVERYLELKERALL